jgi:hypothetical protein
MNWLRKWQALVNKLYNLKPWKDIKRMDLIEFENYILEHKAELLDHLYNMSDDKFNNLIDNIQ